MTTPISENDGSTKQHTPPQIASGSSVKTTSSESHFQPQGTSQRNYADTFFEVFSVPEKQHSHVKLAWAWPRA